LQIVAGTVCLSNVSPFKLPPKLKKLDLSLDFGERERERESERRDNHRLSSMSSRECSFVSSSTYSVLMYVASGHTLVASCTLSTNQYFYFIFCHFFILKIWRNLTKKNSRISRNYTMKKKIPNNSQFLFQEIGKIQQKKKTTAMDEWTFDSNFCLDICK
jgi:hypothetical protein